MIRIKVISDNTSGEFITLPGKSLLDILRNKGYSVYAPCGGKGSCGKCGVFILGEGSLLSCNHFPDKDTEVILPAEKEKNILVQQTEYLEDLPLSPTRKKSLTGRPCGVAVDLGTTTVVLYFLDLENGKIEHISPFLNPQSVYGADVISRISYCQENKEGLKNLRNSILRSINIELYNFLTTRNLNSENIEKVVITGNTTMLHLLLGEDPVPIALSPFKPAFTAMQTKSGRESGLAIHHEGTMVTLPVLSAFIGADILSGLAALKVPHRNYLFLDIGTNGEIALVTGDRIFTCSAAAGPAFEGASISCGMGAVTGAVAEFRDPGNYTVLGNTEPKGICGSGIVDLVAWMVKNRVVDQKGLLREPFVLHAGNNVRVTQQDVREVQLAKSAIYAGMKTVLLKAGRSFSDMDALFIAGGFGNYIDTESGIQIGLLPGELKGKIIPIGNSAGIGALQYLKSDDFETKLNRIISKSEYVELSFSDEFALEFVSNIDFP